MENIPAHISGLLADSKEYIETKAELWKLKTVDRITDVTSSLVSKIAVCVVAGFFVLMLSVGIALWIGDWLGKAMYGFFIVSALYGIAGLILYSFRNRWIKMPLNDSLVEKILKHES